MGAGIPLIQDQDRLEAVWAQVLERLRGLLNGATYSLTFERGEHRFRAGLDHLVADFRLSGGGRHGGR